MRIIHTAVAVVGASVAFLGPLHHLAFKYAHAHHPHTASHSIHPDSVVVESLAGARCVVHLGHGRAAMVGLSDAEHLRELHAWMMALGRQDTSVMTIAIIALPGGLADSAKQRMRTAFHDHAGVRVFLDWGGSVVNHGGQHPMLPAVAVIGADVHRMISRSGMPDSASVGAIRDAIGMAVTESRIASASNHATPATSAPLPLVRCEQSLHSTRCVSSVERC